MGDRGTTTTFGTPGRISKTSPVIELLGTLDELVSILGVCRSKSDSAIADFIFELQQKLFIIQAQVAGAPKEFPSGACKELEYRIEEIEKNLPPIKTFFIPGGTEQGAFLDLARAISRRAERRLVAWGEAGGVLDASSLAYMNRLSSALYALARQESRSSGITETPPAYR